MGRGSKLTLSLFLSPSLLRVASALTRLLLTQTEKSSSKSSTKKESRPGGYPDYKSYVVDLDVKQYHTAYNKCAMLPPYTLRTLRALASRVTGV